MSSTPAIIFGRAAPGLFARDIERSQAFYTDVLGFRKTFENGNPVGFIILKRGDAELHVSLVKDHTPARTNVAHILVDDVDSLHEICVRAGTRIIKSLGDKDYGLRSFVFADPDGNRIDVGQRIGGRRVDFKHCRLCESLFEEGSLAKSTFRDIDLSESHFTNTNLRGAKMNNVDLSDVVIEDARIDGLTIFGYDVSALIRAEIARRERDQVFAPHAEILKE